jgi:hypothetical protein
MSGWFSAISFQKQRNSIFIRFTSGRLERASGRSSLKPFPRLKGTLEYSEILDIVQTCYHVFRTAWRDFPNSVDFWNPTLCWILIDLAFGRCCYDVRTSSSLSAGHRGASRRLQRLVRTVSQEPVVLPWNLQGLFMNIFKMLVISNMLWFVHFMNTWRFWIWKPTILLNCNHYIKWFCLSRM